MRDRETELETDLLESIGAFAIAVALVAKARNLRELDTVPQRAVILARRVGDALEQDPQALQAELLSSPGSTHGKSK